MSNRSLVQMRLIVMIAVAMFSSAVPAVHAPDVMWDDVHPSSETGTTYLSRSARLARQLGVDSSFVALLLESSQTSVSDRFIRINATNYASKTDYSHNYNEKGVRSVRTFMNTYASALNKAETTYSVPANVIAALLWVETKHGTITGGHNVASVFLSVLLSCEPEFIDVNTSAVMAAKGLDTTARDSVRGAMERRAIRKMTWAADQLRGLHAIHKQGQINVFTLKGSWAGAFGYSQFLPQSYVSWAVDGNGDGAVDLFSMDDAICSVANYLRSNGWSNEEKDQRAAVFHYNNSTDYVDAVLTLAAKARQ
mgnify:CR=1 FL=1